MGISGGFREGKRDVILHGYWRSSAAYRVRIALNLKQLSAEHASHHLRRSEQREPDYLRLNPQGLLPVLEVDSGRGVLTQSLAICEWLEETHPEPRLLPRDPVTRAHIRAFALAIACDIHPLQNLKVLRRLRDLGHDQDVVNSWAHDVVAEGLEACEALAPSAGAFLFAAMPTLAEVCLVPQLTKCQTFRGRFVGLSEAARSRAGLPGTAGFHGRCAGVAARRGARLSRRSHSDLMIAALPPAGTIDVSRRALVGRRDAWTYSPSFTEHQRRPEAPSCQRSPPATPSHPAKFGQIASRPAPATTGRHFATLSRKQKYP